MRVEGIIKSVQASVAPGGADVQQIVKMEIFGEWKDLRDLMQRPLLVTLEASQTEFGTKGESPMHKGSVEVTATDNGKRRGRKAVA